VDELVGALHGFHEPLLFFVQRTDDAQSHRFSSPWLILELLFLRKPVFAWVQCKLRPAEFVSVLDPAALQRGLPRKAWRLPFLY
jgi:hypothetical protein